MDQWVWLYWNVSHNTSHSRDQWYNPSSLWGGCPTLWLPMVSSSALSGQEKLVSSGSRNFPKKSCSFQTSIQREDTMGFYKVDLWSHRTKPYVFLCSNPQRINTLSVVSWQWHSSHKQRRGLLCVLLPWTPGLCLAVLDRSTGVRRTAWRNGHGGHCSPLSIRGRQEIFSARCSEGEVPGLGFSLCVGLYLQSLCVLMVRWALNTYPLDIPWDTLSHATWMFVTEFYERMFKELLG